MGSAVDKRMEQGLLTYLKIQSHLVLSEILLTVRYGIPENVTQKDQKT